MLEKIFNKNENSKIKISNKYIIVLVVFAIFLMFVSKKPESEVLVEENNIKESDTAVKIQDTEKRLEEILKKIDGAGDVSVMIYYSNMGEKVVASDTKIRSEKTERGDDTFDLSEDKEHSTVLYGGSSNEQPFVTEEKLPKPSGIIIIAEGAKNEKVKYEISESVRALLGLAPNRIKVVAKSES